MHFTARSLVMAAGLLMVVLLIISGTGTADLAAQQNDAAPIRLQADTFIPAAGEQPDIPPGLTISGYARGTNGYYIVQFNGPVQEDWKAQLAGVGGELLDYIPDFAYKTRMNPAQAARAAGLDSVAWVGLFQPAYKISPSVDLEGTNLLRVRVERGADTGQATAAIRRSGATIINRSENLLIVGADAAQVREIANVLDVAWMEPYVLNQKHNEYGAGVILGANIANTNGYDGSSQIAAVSDTGLGGGTATSAHPDIPSSRILSIYNWPGAASGCFRSITDDGAIDVDSGHGTHTAASVLSDGGAGGEGKGVAPAASLVFQATENWATVSRYCQLFGGWPSSGYFLTGLPDDLRTMYQQAYNDGARIHSNSWGAALAGDYTLDSANTDDFVWDNPDMTITFSAGNEGVDANANGVVDNDSIGSPATAKNVITVGASENDRADNWPCDTSLTYFSYDAYQTGETCSSMGGENLLGTWGQRYGNSFLAEPLFSDVTAGNQEQMASWSSRGPADDGRIKPDVVAPGTWILSGFSGLYQEGYGDPTNPRNGAYQWDGWGMPFNESYKYMGGTSMSNPIAAGAATVVRDYYQKAHGHNASAALVKATLINSAVDLLDENNDGLNDNDYPIPNVHEGWGRVDVAAATDGSRQYIDETSGINTGGLAGYQYNVTTAGQPFKVTLVYSDYASTEAAAANLVNNLDLVVIAPGGAQYKGNVFSGGWSVSGGSADAVNNVENVYLQSAASGTYTVQVSGANVPQGPQPFALVVDGVFGAVDAPPTVSITAPADGATVSGSVTITADAGDDNGVTQVEFFANGSSIGVDTTAPYAASWDSSSTGDGSASLSATATDTIGQTASDTISVTVDNINDPPVAAFSTSCSALSCDFDASASYDPEGTIVSYEWSFGDGGTGSGISPSHTYAAAGIYTVVLTVTDNGGAEDSDTQEITVTQVTSTMHVGDIDSSTSPSNGGKWNATLTFTVHDAGEGAVAGATVSGTWIAGASGSGSCTTDASGQCSFTLSNISRKSSSATFTVNSVTAAGYVYDSAANHDPDGDSNGTTITVTKP
jgi:PKD repeat protein